MSEFDGAVKSHEKIGRFKRVIMACNPADGKLLTRYHILNTARFGIYIHCFHISDDDRAFHDHPWSFITILLSSGYWEHTPTGLFWRRRFSILYRPAEWRHRVEIIKPTWTLVFRWRERRRWGFILPTGWMDFKDYGREFCS